MAIHINLLHEQKTQQKQAERDPLKLGVLGILVVALLFGGFYMWKKSDLTTVEATLADATAEHEKLKPSVARYEEEKPAAEAKIAIQTEITKRIEERFFWAPALEVIAKSASANMQVTRIAGNSTSETVTLRVSGIVADDEPRKTADKLRITLVEGMQRTYDGVASEFSDLKEHQGTIELQGKEYPAVDFEILLKLNRRITPASN